VLAVFLINALSWEQAMQTAADVWELETVAITTILHYSPSEGTFLIGGDQGLIIDRNDPWEILSMLGGTITMQNFLLILEKRSRVIKKTRSKLFPDEVVKVQVHVPIYVLGISGNRVIRFRLIDHSYIDQ
jgi:hypothetical protein